MRLCQKGKSKKASHKSSDTSALTEPLELLHMDLFGPVNMMSMSKKRHALVIVDGHIPSIHGFYSFTPRMKLHIMVIDSSEVD